MTSNEIGFVIIMSSVVLTTLGFYFLAAKAFAPKAFNLAQSLGVRPGLYQNKYTGNIIEIRSIDSTGLRAVAADNKAVWNIEVRTLDSNYNFLDVL